MLWEENPHTFHVNYLANKIIQPQKVYFFFLNKSILCFRGKKDDDDDVESLSRL